MSHAATTWAFAQQIESSTKFVLVALADYAKKGERRVYPSILALRDKTSLDKKTVFVALKRLRDLGLIQDTGNRVGETRSIPMYELHLEAYPKTEQLQKRSIPKNGSGTIPKNGSASPGQVILFAEPEGEPETPPYPPQGGNGQKHLSETQERLCDLFNRRHTTRWNPKEVKAFKAIGDINADDLAAIERYYRKERRKGKEGRHRRDLCTLLNNFQGEVDRANANEPTHWKGSEDSNYFLK